MKHDKDTLKACRKAWDNLAEFRARRARCVDFVQGRQWGDKWKMADGRLVDEAARWLESGRIPITNNLIRRYIKSVIGHYRILLQRENIDDGFLKLSALQPESKDEFELTNIDSRGLEEFMISGLVCQRVEKEDDRVRVRNISPEEIFFHKFKENDASDCSFLGVLHSMTLTEIMRRFAKGSSKRAKALFEAFAKTEGDDTPPLMPARIDFSSTDSADRRRVVEVWTKKSQMLMHIADKMSGKLYSGIFSEQVQKNIEKYNRCRADKELPQLLTQMEIVDTWHEKWLSPDGMVLLERSHLPGKNPPILLQAYPMIDGESRSPVEDLLDQQKYVNRLVMLVDDVLTSTAKGVVLFPADQIPEGLTWQDVKRIWASPSGILPFKRTSKTIMPQQINPGTSFPGAVDMLQTQLSLFDDIAGIASGNSTHNTATGADMLRQQRENVMVSMLDLLIGFRSLTLRRDALIQTLSS